MGPSKLFKLTVLDLCRVIGDGIKTNSSSSPAETKHSSSGVNEVIEEVLESIGLDVRLSVRIFASGIVGLELEYF